MKQRLTTIRNWVIHILVLIVIFIGAVAGFSRIINQVTPDVAESMPETTFPLVYMQKKGVNFNCLHGYEQEMDVSYIRDTITPLESDRSLSVQIQTFSTSVESVSYEVKSLDGSTTLENTKVIQLDRDGDYINATLTLQSGMLMNREYILKLQLTSGGRNLYYYTHILLADGLHTQEYINFVSGFYDKCVNRTDLDTVGAAVEPDETTDEEQTLAYMDIHDSVAQLTWGSLYPQIFYKPTPQLKEINTNTGSLTLDYRIASVNENGITEIFNVHEFYRVRFTDSRVFLLNFERTTDEVFNPENNVVSTEGIRLGVTGKDVQYSSDQKNNVIAFVQEDELWTFDTRTEILTQIFSFPQKENMDFRDFYDANSIRILRVDTEGNVWFAVAGYMNRGSHEGENGVGVYLFDTATSMVDEKIFLKSMESPELLERDLEKLAYISNDSSKFSILLEENVYTVNLATRSLSTMVTKAENNCIAGSASGRYFAWLPEGQDFDSTTLSVLDLETGKTENINCGKDERIHPICYMGEDLVYGIARTSDINVEHGGNGIFPMYRILIVNGEGNILKDYQPEGCYVTDAVLTDNMLTLTRVSRNGETFEEAEPDHIVNTDTSSSVALGAATKTTTRKQTEVYLRVGSTVAADALQIVRGKIITYETSRTISIPPSSDRQRLYDVYAGGGLLERCNYVNDAVRIADEHVGVVLDADKNYVWVRGDRETNREIKLKDIPEAVLSGTMDTGELAKATGKEILDLSGCTLDQVLYLVSHGSPVIADAGDRIVTIVGYDEFNVFLVDPGGEEWYYSGMNDSAEMFEKAGNVFLSYVAG